MALAKDLNCSLAFWPMLFLQLIFLNSTTTFLQLVTAIGNETDRFALLKFKESIHGDPLGVLTSWNDSVHFCNWPGIACDRRHQRLTALHLEDYDLRGTISPHIGNLSFLRSVDLGNNSFSGEIPQQFGNLFRLQHVNLSFNMLEGKIPVNLSYCSQLRVLDLGGNRLNGMIPSELGSLANLEQLSLSKNSLTGGIPPSLGNISSLRVFDSQYNHLAGAVPDELGKLKSLTFFAIAANNFSGVFPLSIFNISSITTFTIASNNLKGTLPPTIGLTLPSLQRFFIGTNELSGTIPESLSNASQLQIIDMSSNSFVGQVPSNLGDLSDLRNLNLESNYLGNGSAKSLDFVTSLTNCSSMRVLSLSINNFAGVLPKSVANLSTSLSQLYFGVNGISGNIPETLENLANLVILGLEYNLFTGVIPSSLGKLKNLRSLTLGYNEISGNIPSSIGNLTQLFKLYITRNKLEGRIPPDIANCQKLQYFGVANNRLNGTIPREIFGRPSSLLFLNLSRNRLSGNLPVEVGNLKSINRLDLSLNNLTGEIPEAIRDCQSVEFLDLHGNFFHGRLPSALPSLRGLQYLDLSRNNLNGKIPKELENLHYLLYLNFSFNHLEGEVPNKGVFRNISAVSVVGNTELCGGVPELQLPGCPNKEIKRGKTRGLKLAIIIVCTSLLFLLFSGFIIFYWRTRSQKKSSNALSVLNSLSKVSYKRLYEATNGFSPTMLIGTGGFGTVYKGVLDQEKNLVAVKVLNLHKKGAEKSFVAECNALRIIRHRNLVKVLTCCSSMDYSGNDFKALVFEYMSNGSLEKRLHLGTDQENLTGDLSLIQRLNIAIDVASAMHYLHDSCDEPIIHCDLKPSNVLLDSETVAHVSDFGLARLISNSDSLSDSKTCTTGIKGTIGYVAPEYATGGEPSKEGDTYSYGILVLEMFTGRRPTDEMFKDDFNLHNFVKAALPGNLVRIVDSALLPREVDETAMRSEDRINYNNNRDAEMNNIGDSQIDEERGNIAFQNRSEISAHLHKCLLSVLEIGLACSQESPNERMKMGDVINELHHIRNLYLRVGVHRQRQRANGAIES